MSLRVLNAHTGEQYTPDQASQRSLENLRTWLSKKSSIVVADQIILTPQGKQAKLAALSTEAKLFLYDRKLIASSSSSAVSKTTLIGADPSLSLSIPSLPVNSPIDQNDIEAWTRVFEARQDWAQDIYRNSKTLAVQVHRQYEYIDNIYAALAVATGNLQSHIRTLETRYGEAREWGKQTYEEQKSLARSLDVTLGHLPYLPATPEFKIFLPRLGFDQHTHKSVSMTRSTLDRLVSQKDIDAATINIQQAHEDMMEHLESIDSAVNGVIIDRDELVSSVENLGTQSAVDRNNNAIQLMEEIEVIAKKITSDYEHVANSPASPKSVNQASKWSMIHTKSYIPSLREYFEEMAGILQQASDERNSAAIKSLEKMQSIARVEATFSKVNAKLMDLDLSSDVEDSMQLINLVNQLPFVYGALLVEAVRRREWSARLQSDSAALAEDIAGYREEEEKRRKKWLKNMGLLIDEEAAGKAVPRFEVNLEQTTQDWPDVNRDDISEYLHALRTLNGVDEIVEELSEAAKDLDRPSKRQIKKAKGLVTNSIHEGNGRGSFLMKDNEETKVLQEMNMKLEEDVKGQKSRIRKLEELLYRQEVGRPSSANMFARSDGQRIDSPVLDPGSPSSRTETGLSRKASSGSRRPSGTKTAEEKSLARRLVALEAELAEEKQARSDEKRKHEDEIQARNEKETLMEAEMREYESTKQDLMANMEAQQRELADERHLLQEEVKESKMRLEEMEEEIDRLLGSRDNEQQSTDEKLKELNTALTDAKQRVADAESEVSSHQQNEAKSQSVLRSMLAGLTGTEIASEPSSDLLIKIDRQLTNLKNAMEAAKSDKDALQATFDRQEKDFVSSKDRTRALEEEGSALRSDYAAEKAKAESLSSELDNTREQLKGLHSKFAEGETGSEALRSRLEDQACRATRLATELAQTKSHVNSLDFELSSLQRRHKDLLDESSANSERLEQRTVRDRELTAMLVSVQSELVRLLDALGLSIIHKDGGVAIQRTSKLSSGSTSGLTDPSQSVIQLSTSVDVQPDSASSQWMLASTADEEAKAFASFSRQMSVLKLSTFSEAIVKLRRDIEWTGKKWKQEARNYRDKYHRAQSEAHDKIAFRSFKEGDLALFLPTRNQATRPWAAFNVGAPQYFLSEQDAHRLPSREWLVARITKISERVVDLSKTISAHSNQRTKANDASSIKSTASEGANSFEDDNPFGLSDGLRWYLLEATEERPGAPSTPGLAKSTVASANVDAKGSVRIKRTSGANDASAKLGKSLESRRSSSSSKRASITAIPEETQRELSALGSSNLRPASRSSGHGQSIDTSGLGLVMSGSPAPMSPTTQSGKERNTTEEASASNVSLSKRPFLSIFTTSSPSKHLKQNRGFSATLDSSSKSPSKLRPQGSSAVISPSSKGSRELALDIINGDTQEEPPDRSPQRIDTSGDQPQNTQTARHPYEQREQEQIQSKPPWESLWSLDLNYDERDRG